MGKFKEKEKQRTLTASEAKRKIAFDELSANLQAQGYQSKELTVGIVFANVMAFILGAPFLIGFSIWFFIYNGGVIPTLSLLETAIFGISMFALIFVHEGIHGLCWGTFAKEHFKSISFGFAKEYLTPYCTCKDPLKKWQYIVGAMMPTILLGILPSVISVYAGSGLLLYIGIIMIIAGGGDMLVSLKLLFHRSAGREAIYVDHPYLCGLISFER
ncbi:MAG: DUF3267 domain-containing protein [Agathobacter sp.]|nr:DUF3267 domain-containing protein [Agathobacter sp.]